MASLDSLPADQRAVLDLVLRRGRTYDEIAALLAIDRAAVRARALAALDVLGPETGVPPERRALITDYLLGQLPDPVAEQTRERLAESAAERAWARVLASELEPVASNPLPEIPTDAESGSAQTAGAETATAEASHAAAGADPRPPRPARPRRTEPRRDRRPKTERTGSFLNERPSSRLGGALMLLVGVIVVIVVVVLVVPGGSKKTNTGSASSGATTAPKTSTSAGSGTSSGATTGTSTSTGTSGGTSTTSTSKAQVVAQINLNPPSGTGSEKGVAFVVKEGGAYGVIIEAQHMAPNSHNAYAAWLSSTPTDSVRLGFVNPGVGTKGTLETGGTLPTNAGSYKELLITLETSSNPKTPGTVVLEGAFKGVPATS
jgi:hypothetical protein